MSDSPKLKARSTKATSLVVAVVFTVSVSGFFMGLRQTVHESGVSNEQPKIVPAHGDHEQSESQALSAPSYWEIRDSKFKVNQEWKSRLSSLDSSGNLANRQPYDEQLLRLRRQERRAYDGAPPVVPHPIDQHTAESCLQCHSKALQIGSVVAPAISHPEYTSCTQCHVSGKGLGSRWNASTFDMHTGNGFGGYHQPVKGERAYPDAPPTIPHQVHMRQSCMSCHGEMGTSPIRTSHPERQSCTQCHVPGSDVDKRNFSESPFPFYQKLSEGEPES
ncbi:nitrate reductase cytochrome c-type subunit [Pelagicoccus sp. SDUM812003]|uniref:nitrate reductase cytochrome c-type subunit n=1 Tax=Pelagicoccus sp. SDUM812003 TaxID=3041267 RepID=UPI00280DF600|nr:nitrate reductase cytochrome c-type subunit [Pelagicoccus sp. SDUM812003]MDQ8202414.1 nitrate reductase cytochrome c-type subunit [Pelagicoccus sp. SDUM812003]